MRPTRVVLGSFCIAWICACGPTVVSTGQAASGGGEVHAPVDTDGETGCASCDTAVSGSSTSGADTEVLADGLLASGSAHNCAVLPMGAVRCWGSGKLFGQLGYANTEIIGDDETPASVGDVSVGARVTQVAAGNFQTCVLLEDGAVRCWGRAEWGQLGYGNTDQIGDDEWPRVAGNVDVGAPVVQLAMGLPFTCALLDNGAVRCWGGALSGYLGYGDTERIGDDESPASAGNVPVGQSVVQLAAGWHHVCAVLDDAAVRCWGSGRDGRLGYGNENDIGDDETPASAGNVDVGAPVVRLSAGGYHTCAVTAGGSVRCWGRGDAGQLGYGNEADIGDDEPPSSAGDVDVGGRVVDVAAGWLHTCALMETGAVRCWGAASRGQTGHGDTKRVGDDETPASADDVALGGRAVQLTAGDLHTCALLDTGSVRCWGDSEYGQLGYGSTASIGDDEPPASAGDVPVGW